MDERVAVRVDFYLRRTVVLSSLLFQIFLYLGYFWIAIVFSNGLFITYILFEDDIKVLLRKLAIHQIANELLPKDVSYDPSIPYYMLLCVYVGLALVSWSVVFFGFYMFSEGVFFGFHMFSEGVMPPECTRLDTFRATTILTSGACACTFLVYRTIMQRKDIEAEFLKDYNKRREKIN